MNAKTEEFLYFLLWTCDMLSRPTFRNLTGSYESWAYRNGLHRKLADLERRGLLESAGSSRRSTFSPARLLRLTEAGRLHALGGRDPQRRWSRPWDGVWRLVLFDLPNAQTRMRDTLRRALARIGFGYLQNSVWISPDTLDSWKACLGNSKVDVESLIVLEGRPCAGESDAAIVAGAWDFDRINGCYERHRIVLAQRPRLPICGGQEALDFRRWATEERLSWLKAVTQDPLLPQSLLPKNYLGQKAWRRRHDVMRLAAEQLQSFHDPDQENQRTLKNLVDSAAADICVMPAAPTDIRSPG